MDEKMKLGNVCLLTISGCLVHARIQAQAFDKWSDGVVSALCSRLYPSPSLVLKGLMRANIKICSGLILSQLAKQVAMAFGGALIER